MPSGLTIPSVVRLIWNTAWGNIVLVILFVWPCRLSLGRSVPGTLPLGTLLGRQQLQEQHCLIFDHNLCRFELLAVRLSLNRNMDRLHFWSTQKNRNHSMAIMVSTAATHHKQRTYGLNQGGNLYSTQLVIVWVKLGSIPLWQGASPYSLLT